MSTVYVYLDNGDNYISTWTIWHGWHDVQCFVANSLRCWPDDVDTIEPEDGGPSTLTVKGIKVGTMQVCRKGQQQERVA